MWSKACTRCGGDVYEERYLGDSDVKCLQCGYTLPAPQAAMLKRVPTSLQGRRRPAASQRRAA